MPSYPAQAAAALNRDVVHEETLRHKPQEPVRAVRDGKVSNDHVGLREGTEHGRLRILSAHDRHVPAAPGETVQSVWWRVR